jgi:hypothetical protein
MRSDFSNPANPDTLVESLHRLPAKTPPAGLRTSLRIIASRERQRRITHHNLRSILQLWWDHLQLSAEHLVRTMALPFAGGICSTLVLFSMFVVPAYPLLHQKLSQGSPSTEFDVPTMLTTQGSVKSISPFSAGDDDIVVDVAVDEQGRMIDYAVVAGASALANREVRRRLENALVFSNFNPATAFGQPMVSKVRLWFHSSRIEVRG